MNNGHEKSPTRQVRAKTAWRAKAAVLYAAICGLALLVLVAHYPGVGWVLLPWLIVAGCAVGQARNLDR